MHMSPCLFQGLKFCFVFSTTFSPLFKVIYWVKHYVFLPFSNFHFNGPDLPPRSAHSAKHRPPAVILRAVEWRLHCASVPTLMILWALHCSLVMLLMCIAGVPLLGDVGVRRDERKGC